MKIFISSVQSEFAEERRTLKDFIQGNALLCRFFTVFIFEDTPAEDRKPDSVYLEEVADCDPEMNKLISDIGSELVYHLFQDKSELIEVVYNALVTFLESKRLIITGPFDESTSQNATLKDISDDKMEEFIRRARNVRSFPMAENTEKSVVLKHLNLLTDNTPRNASILLFGKKPQNFFITSEVKCMMFYGNTVTKPIPSYQIYKGTVFEMVDQAVDFVMSRVDCYVGEAIESNQVPVEYEIPHQVVREAVVNAVAHRDYTSNSSVQVMLFKDRLEIWNPGRLPSYMSISKLYEPHSSVPANPLIAEAMYRAGYIEKAGTGTIDMISRCREAKIPEPVFSVEPGKFIISFKRKSSLTDQVTPHVTPHATPHVTPHVTPQDKVLLSSFQNRLIAILVGEKSRTELMETLNLRDRKSFMNNYIEPTIVFGYVQMTIPESPKNINQKYCLTELGQKIKNEFTGHDTPHDTPHDKLIFSDLQNKMIKVMDKEISRVELMEKLNLNDRENFRLQYLEPLLNANLIERTIPEKPKSKNQKYRLTTQGQRLQKELKAGK